MTGNALILSWTIVADCSSDRSLPNSLWSSVQQSRRIDGVIHNIASNQNAAVTLGT
ncbi:hypothetical protein SAMN06265222_10594 [Neorhodopirellula lusitana]|uniref:Uncharacterized protein n=1 Tax=Neorhodopirellula lusitana TaxID=445327 RepID=A0ABY1Q5K6_9BACT|nr:hypothetical protein SAMN06265222_10594 [Neorhodopirellula lusitana]